MNKIVLASLTAASLAVSSLVLAGPTTRTVMPCTSAPSHWYVGIGANYNSVLSEKRAIESDKYNYSLDTRNLGYNLFVGNRLTPAFAAEFGLSHVGDTAWKFDSSKKDNFEVDDEYIAYFDGYYFLPLANSFEVFAKGGVNYYTVENEYMSKDGQKATGFGLNYGAGLQYNYQQFGARVAYTRIVPSHDIDLSYNVSDAISLDVMWQFT